MESEKESFSALAERLYRELDLTAEDTVSWEGDGEWHSIPHKVFHCLSNGSSSGNSLAVINLILFFARGRISECLRHEDFSTHSDEWSFKMILDAVAALEDHAKKMEERIFNEKICKLRAKARECRVIYNAAAAFLDAKPSEAEADPVATSAVKYFNEVLAEAGALLWDKKLGEEKEQDPEFLKLRKSLYVPVANFKESVDEKFAALLGDE